MAGMATLLFRVRKISELKSHFPVKRVYEIKAWAYRLHQDNQWALDLKAYRGCFQEHTDSETSSAHMNAQRQAREVADIQARSCNVITTV